MRGRFIGDERCVDSHALNPEGAWRVNARWRCAAQWRAVAAQPTRNALVAIFSMLCTRQNSCHCVATLALPRSVKRLMRLWWRMSATTGLTVAMRRLYSAQHGAESLPQLQMHAHDRQLFGFHGGMNRAGALTWSQPASCVFMGPSGLAHRPRTLPIAFDDYHFLDCPTTSRDGQYGRYKAPACSKNGAPISLQRVSN
jgi:hypothetical protein